MLHSGRRTMQESSVINMAIEKLYEHAQTFMERQAWVPTGAKNLPACPEGGAYHVYNQGEKLRCPKSGVVTSWTMHRLTTHIKNCKSNEEPFEKIWSCVM